MLDYITEEQGGNITQSSLHYGADLGLGVHDHWDNFESKQYSLIDYVNVDLGMNQPPAPPTNLRIVGSVKNFV